MVDLKYITLAKAIQTDIETHVYREGQRIPPIRQLAELYHVNPQTAQKAVAHLASLGLLESRRGAGSRVREAGLRTGVPLLIDRQRAGFLDHLNDLTNYHARDIYLCYLMETSARKIGSGFLIYDRDETLAPPRFERELDSAQAVIVLGDLPACRMEVLGKRGIPTVHLNRLAPEGPGRMASVMIPARSLQDLAQHLYSMGHQKFLFVLSRRFDAGTVFTGRLEAFRRALASCKLGPDRVEVFEFQEASDGDAQRLKSLVSRGWTAAVAYNDLTALGLYDLAARAGLSVPGQVSVTGFDDIPVAQIVTPPLTTIHVDRKELVRLAFQALDQLRAGSTPRRMILEVPTSLITRRSVQSAGLVEPQTPTTKENV